MVDLSMMMPLALRWAEKMKKKVAGSLEACLEKYLQQVVAFGYRNAPLEVDARKYEVEQ